MSARLAIEAGAHGVAVSSDLLNASDIEGAARELVEVVAAAAGEQS